jgi:hypothetical protein
VTYTPAHQLANDEPLGEVRGFPRVAWHAYETPALPPELRRQLP